MNKTEILSQALTVRENEVLGYQINIDNYSLAINHIDALEKDEQTELAEFRKQLVSLLKSEQLEQKKANVMLAVIRQQITQ